MARPRIVVIGGSAGGLEALLRFVGALGPRFPAPIAVVIHSSPTGLQSLPGIIGRTSELRAARASDGEVMQPGTVYVAPPDHQMLVRGSHLHVLRGPRENGHRPAIDPLFRSAAASYGPQAVGVILSGSLDDGTAGLAAIVERGGTAIVQDPADALFPGMPTSAISHVRVEHVVSASDLAATLERVVRREIRDLDAVRQADSLEYESDVIDPPLDLPESPERPPSPLTCPECQGSLWEFRDGEAVHYRCRVGHAYSPQTLLSAQSNSLEAALWAAVRSLQERATLADRLAEQARARGGTVTAERFAARADEARERSEIIREALLSTTEQMEDPDAVGEGDVNGRTGDIEETG
jgi:two-component system, chemotaxis family, protein-glutamate methylesterase/glutaminase